MKFLLNICKRIVFGSIFFLVLSGCNVGKNEPTRDTISIVAVGDVNFGTDYLYSSIPSKDRDNLFNACSKIISSADIAFCNLETVLCSGGRPSKNPDGKGMFVFRAPAEFSRILTDAGFDVVSIANNHIRDFGIYGEKQTKDALKSVGIQYLSIDGEIAQYASGKTKIAFVGFTAGLRNRSVINPENVFNEIRELSNKFDILVVSFHAGAEGEQALHTRNKTELYLGENRGNPVLLAHGAVDNGADIVLMHGPHVPRGVELYRNRFIAYSLGNFLNYGWKLNTHSKIAPLIWINIYPDGRPAKVIIYSFIQNKPGFPEFDKQHRAYKLIKTLTDKDMPSQSIQFVE